jgi:ferric-dicitrate binding protein FerR (iron transport regulator)
VSTPRGSQYQILLPDGSRVWLDAASSLRFPTAFTGVDRKVFLTGQAYFEVVKNKEKPFRVSLPPLGNDAGEIEVLGTRFNVNTYKEESNIKATLLEGSIRLSVVNHQESTILSPNEQAVLIPSGKLKLSKDVDLDATMAWKNGVFRFNGDAPLDVIMAQVARWYDVDVVFKDKLSYPFVATIRRDVPLSDLLKLLEMTKLVRFDIEGRTVTVMKGE